MAETRISVERAVILANARGLKTEIHCSGGNVWLSAIWGEDDRHQVAVHSTPVSSSGVLAE